MTIPRVKAAGWSANAVFRSTEATDLDKHLNERALDKGAGQTDTLSSDITVAATASINFAAGGELGGTPTIPSGAGPAFAAGSSISGVTEATLTYSSGSTVENAGEELLSGVVTVASTATVTVSAGATVALGGDTTRTAKMTMSGSGARTIYRHDLATLGDADATFDVSKDVWSIRATLTASHNYTVRSSTAPVPVAGEQIKIVSTGSGNFVRNIKREGSGANIVALPGSSWSSATVFYDGTNWRLLDASVNSTPGADA